MPLFGLWSDKLGHWVSNGIGMPFVADQFDALQAYALMEKYQALDARVVRLEPQGTF